MQEIQAWSPIGKIPMLQSNKSVGHDYWSRALDSRISNHSAYMPKLKAESPSTRALE